MLWQDDPKKYEKYLLLDFLIKSQLDFRDMNPEEISLAESYEYIDKFMESYYGKFIKQWEDNDQ